MAMLEVTSLGISFGGLRAVDELSMKIEKGGLVGLIARTARAKPRCSICSPAFTARLTAASAWMGRT